MTRKSVWVLCLAMLSPVAMAQQRSGGSAGQGWSFAGSQTVGAGATVLGAEVGFPGLNITVLHGLQDRFDLGGRISAMYAYESMVRWLHPGIKGEALGRLELMDSPRFGLAANFGIGVFGTFAFTNIIGLTMPLGLTVGIPLGSAMVASFGLEMPMFVTFGTLGGLSVPVLAGVGLEYFLDRSLALTFNTRMGAVLNPTVVTFRDAEFGFEALLGVALKL